MTVTAIMDHAFFVSTEPLIRIVGSLPQRQYEACIHIRNVAERIRMMLASFSKEERKAGKFSAQYHDIGKFLKPYRQLFFEHEGKFNEEQRRKADRHAYASCEVVIALMQQGKIRKQMDVVAPALFAIRGHHWTYEESKRNFEETLQQAIFAEFAAWLDRGDFKDIALDLGRFLKVADYFEARTEKRHYLKINEKPLSSRQAIEVIESMEGVIFDPYATELLKQTVVL